MKTTDIYWTENLLAKIKALNPGSSDFHLMVSDLIRVLNDYLQANPAYVEDKIIERLIEPEQMLLFRVTWRDDKGKLNVNKGYYVKMSAVLGTPQGGIRFHPGINLGLLKAMALEKTLQNSLTGLPVGGAMAAADFDAKNKSEAEVMRFCQAYMTDLYQVIGPNAALLYGDIGVGQREIGFLYGQYKKLSRQFEPSLLDKGMAWGGTQLRLPASGYGLSYFLQAVLAAQGHSLRAKRMNISGAGQVALHAAEKAIALGAVVQTLSDTSGCMHVPEGISLKQLRDIKTHKLFHHANLQTFAHKAGLHFFAGKNPWSIPCEIALPCACESEIQIKDAENLSDNGCLYLVEGAFRACDMEARQWLLGNQVRFVPGKLSTLGHAMIHALELNQNNQKLSSTSEDIDDKLQKITEQMHKDCEVFCKHVENIDYVKAADTLSFVRIADAMIAQGDF